MDTETLFKKIAKELEIMNKLKIQECGWDEADYYEEDKTED